MAELDDEQLVREAQAGSLRSFNLLVERYQSPLYGLALRYVGDAQDAEDVTQEAFISAWRSLAGFKGGSFRAWLYRIAVNEAYDLHRKTRRRPTSSLDDLLAEGSLGGLDTDPTPGPEQVAVSRATVRAVERCLGSLAPEYRLIVLLSDVQGLSYDEMAQALGLPLGTVKSRLFRARAALRAALAASGELA